MIKKALYGITGLFVLVVVIALISNSEPKKELTTDSLGAEATIERVSTSTGSVVQEIKTEKTNNEVSSLSLQDEGSQYAYYSVASVVDGDTIKVNIDGVTETLRLIGIDTPETVDPRKPVQCFGVEASNKAKELLSGKKVRVEKDQTQGDKDKYGRLLVYIYREDGLFFNKYMIEKGYAHEYTYDLPYKYQSEFKAAETYARENQLGFWSPSTCNGDTISVAEETAIDQPSSQNSEKYYTSSYPTAKYYYPKSCLGWQSLSKSYLREFDSLDALLKVFPSKTLSPQCQ